MSLWGLRYRDVSKRRLKSITLDDFEKSIFETSPAGDIGILRTMLPRCLWLPCVPVTYQPPHRSFIGVSSVVGNGIAPSTFPFSSGIMDETTSCGTNFFIP